MVRQGMSFERALALLKEVGGGRAGAPARGAGPRGFVS
jgi:hypothetical protein